jgi:ZIP family zinc transporter
VRQFLNALAIGILLFLIWDVLVHAFEPIDTALGRLHDGSAGIAPVLGYAALFFLGLTVGLMSLVYYEAWLASQRKPRTFGPGTMAPGELTAARPGIAGWSAARRMSLLIAVGIGLHNFAEGLAIGQSSASGEIALALMLVIGFGLHNATEGFGIVAPLTADVDDEGNPRRPSWAFLLMLGAIGGGPTFIGTVVGHSYTSEPLSVVFLALAAGSILYVIIQLIGVASRARRADLLAYGLLLGLAAGFITDGILVAAGA